MSQNNNSEEGLPPYSGNPMNPTSNQAPTTFVVVSQAPVSTSNSGPSVVPMSAMNNMQPGNPIFLSQQQQQPSFLIQVVDPNANGNSNSSSSSGGVIQQQPQPSYQTSNSTYSSSVQPSYVTVSSTPVTDSPQRNFSRKGDPNAQKNALYQSSSSLNTNQPRQQPSFNRPQNTPGTLVMSNSVMGDVQEAEMVTQTPERVYVREVDNRLTFTTNHIREGAWKDSVWNCFANIWPALICSCVCPCYVHAQMSEYMQLMPFDTYQMAFWGLNICGILVCATPLGCAFDIYSTYEMRGRMRQDFDIPGGWGTDCCLVCCCYPCATSQMMRHIYKYEGVCDGEAVTGNKDGVPDRDRLER